MPDPDRLLITLRRAILATRQTAGQRGRFVEIPLNDADADIMVAGDLHGNLANLRLLLQQADLVNNPSRHLVLQEVIHGPFYYPDGSDKSHQMLDLMAALKIQYPDRFHFLLGNHELAQLTNAPVSKRDLDLNFLFEQGVASAYGKRSTEIYRAYMDFLHVTPVALRTSNRVFISHSLPARRTLNLFRFTALESDPDTEIDLESGGTIHSLVWGRDTAPEHLKDFLGLVDADILISGHIPCENGFEAPSPHQLILDSQDTPAAFVLFPMQPALSHAELVGKVRFL